MSCGHLKQSKNYKELLKSFSAISRYSLLYRNKLSLKVNKKGKELRAVLKVDNPEPEIVNSNTSQNSSTSQQKKKALQASGMEKVISGVEKLPTPKCSECEEFMFSSRLHCCLECVYTGCMSSHMNKHYQATNHGFAVDFVNLTVYCFDCKDYVYCHDIDSRLEREEYILHFISTRISEPYSTNNYHPTWIPTINEKQLMATKYTTSKCTGILVLM